MDDALARAGSALTRAERHGLLQRSNVLFHVARSCNDDVVVYVLKPDALEAWRRGEGFDSLVDIFWLQDGGRVRAELSFFKMLLLGVDLEATAQADVLRVRLRPPGLRRLECHVVVHATRPPRIVMTLNGADVALRYAYVEFALFIPYRVTLFGKNDCAALVCETFGVY